MEGLIMPLYEYQCEKCGWIFDCVRSVSDRSNPALCEKCGTHNGKLQISLMANTPPKWGDTGKPNSWAT